MNNLKSTKVELAARVNYVYELRMMDMPYCEIVRHIVLKYAVSSKTGERYHFMTNVMMVDKNELSKKKKVAFYKNRKLRALRDMDPAEKKTAAGVMAINKVLDSMAKMDGVLVEKIELSGNKDNPLEVVVNRQEIDYSLLSTEVLMALVSARKK